MALTAVLAAVALPACGPSGDDVETDGSWSDWFESSERVVMPDSLTPLLVDHALGRGQGRDVMGGDHAGGVLLRRYLGPDVSTVAEGTRAARSMDARLRWLLDVPYWVSIHRPVGSVTNGGLLVAANIAYPIYIYDMDGILVDSIDTPPDSWRPPRPPAMGEFPPERGDAWRRYLQEMTLIAGLASLEGDIVVVAHGRYAEVTELPRRVAPTTADIYEGGRKLAEDVPTPGRLIAHGPRSVFMYDGTEIVRYTWIGGS